MKRKHNFQETYAKRVCFDEDKNESEMSALTNDLAERYLSRKFEILGRATSMLDKLVFKVEKFYVSPTFGLDNPEKLKKQEEAVATDENDLKMDEEGESTYEFPKDTFENTEDI